MASVFEAEDSLPKKKITPFARINMPRESIKLFFSICRWPRDLATVVISLLLPGFVWGQTLAVDSPLSHLVNDYCISCHNPDKKKGKLDLESIA